MIKTKLLVTLSILLIMLTGCVDSENINIDEVSTSPTTGKSDFILDADTTPPANSSTSNVDYDFTSSSSTMIFAQVYELTSNPTDYVDKTFKISGTYQSQYVESLSTDIMMLSVNDEGGCCTQSIELLFKDDVKIPENSEKITVEGTYIEKTVADYPHYYLEVYSLS